MSLVETDNHSLEENETAVSVPNGRAQENPHVSTALQEETANEAAFPGEHACSAADKDLSNSRVFNMAAREVDEGYMSVIRGLSTFCRADEEVCHNAVDICKDIISLEQSLFSEVPSYIAQYISLHCAKSIAHNKTVQAQETIPTADGAPRNWEVRRAYVDPGVPLRLPYDFERFKKEHPERAKSEGTYHNLFYGDGSEVVFLAKADNKRRQIEEEQSKHSRPSHRKLHTYEPKPKKPMRVSADFVPSCAEVTKPSTASQRKPVSKTKAKKTRK
ncbi:hypothetical protein JKF63_04571 [Porcisia hertigi]|uniref:Uncharacterized protein n=1 Tax=Porcisia hertigi TaxID=2761500 RepID=A0A836IKH8_9TRYP|nr:hypothetical protein JKF63_04571 [Porcisia hertigi]